MEDVVIIKQLWQQTVDEAGRRAGMQKGWEGDILKGRPAGRQIRREIGIAASH